MDCSACTLFKTNTGLLCVRFANTICSIHQTFAVHNARFEVRVLCAFSFALCATALSKVVWHSIRFSTFRRAFTNWSNESGLVLVISRKLLGCIPVIFNFLDNLFSTQTELIQHKMLSHVLWCKSHSCRLPFGYHHLRIHRFVSRTPQHFCSIVEY